MHYVNLTLATPEANLACDEALLDWCDAAFDGDILRLWRPREHFIVLGYAKRAREEVRLDACRRLGIPILRRCSGGGTVLQGPGCLNFSLILRAPAASPLSTIAGTNAFVMERHRRMLQTLLGQPVSVNGSTDLTVSDLRKCSGNSQRRKRRAVLFHGTFLLGLDLELMAALLPMPAQQPSYRRRRSHAEFLTNLRIPPARLQRALRSAWRAVTPLRRLPRRAIQELAKHRYATSAWNFMR